MNIKFVSKLLLLIVLVIVSPVLLYHAFLFAAHDFNRYVLQIDSCLDAGGSWDYEKQECNFIQMDRDQLEKE